MVIVIKDGKSAGMGASSKQISQKEETLSSRNETGRGGEKRLKWKTRAREKMKQKLKEKKNICDKVGVEPVQCEAILREMLSLKSKI